MLFRQEQRNKIVHAYRQEKNKQCIMFIVIYEIVTRTSQISHYKLSERL